MTDDNTSSANNSIEPGSSNSADISDTVDAIAVSTADLTPTPPSSSETPVKKAERNMLVPGLNADELVLPWESEDELRRIHAELKEDWNPQGRAEREAVFDLAYLTWLKHRASRIEQINVHKRSWPAPASPEVKKQLSKARDAGKRAVKLLKDASKNLEDIPTHNNSYQTRDIEGAVLEVRGLQDVISQVLVPSLSTIAADKTTAMSGVPPMDFVAIERSVKLKAAIDKRFDRTFSRFVALRTHKRLKSKA